MIEEMSYKIINDHTIIQTDSFIQFTIDKKEFKSKCLKDRKIQILIKMMHT